MDPVQLAVERAALFEQRPDLEGTTVQITSPSTRDYNCIAWAAGDNSRVWSPAVGPGGQSVGGYYWPPDVPALPSVSAVEQLFIQRGFTVTDRGDTALEPGVEKVAIFGEDEMGCVTHAARQGANGRWLSKMGDLADVEHDLLDVEGVCYGILRSVLRKSRHPEGPTACSPILMRA